MLGHMPSVSNAPSVPPPVIEVAVAVAFDRYHDLGAVNLALLAQAWKEEFPVLREVPGAPPQLLDPRTQGIEFGTGPMPTRLWLMSLAGNDLVQIQNDLLIYNWRLVQPGDVYPGHQWILQKFEELWSDFVRRLGEYGPMVPRLVEWTYVDKLGLSKPSNNLLTFVDESISMLPGSGSNLSFQVVRELKSGDAVHGFLAVQGSPARQQGDVEDFFALNITTKLDTKGAAADDVPRILLDAHDVSFEAFTCVVPTYRREEEGVGGES